MTDTVPRPCPHSGLPLPPSPRPHQFASSMWSQPKVPLIVLGILGNCLWPTQPPWREPHASPGLREPGAARQWPPACILGHEAACAAEPCLSGRSRFQWPGVDTSAFGWATLAFLWVDSGGRVQGGDSAGVGCSQNQARWVDLVPPGSPPSGGPCWQPSKAPWRGGPPFFPHVFCGPSETLGRKAPSCLFLPGSPDCPESVGESH